MRMICRTKLSSSKTLGLEERASEKVVHINLRALKMVNMRLRIEAIDDKKRVREERRGARERRLLRKTSGRKVRADSQRQAQVSKSCSSDGAFKVESLDRVSISQYNSP